MKLSKKKKAEMSYVAPKKPLGERMKTTWRNCWQLYVMLLIPIVYMLIFNYYPMYGAQIAFRNYKFNDGIWGSAWVGLEHFTRFVENRIFWRLIGNTLSISLYSLFMGMPFPIILAILLKYCQQKRFMKFAQTITYAPHFISVVVMTSIIMRTLDPRNGMVSNLLKLIGVEFTTDYLGVATAFNDIYVWSGIWQGMGFASIIYIAILAGVDPSLHEAAMLDGASILQRIRHIDFPALMPQITIMLILNMGSVLSVGFEKVLLLQNTLNATSSEVISTYVYKQGIASSFPDYSYTTAIGLFQSIIAFILIVIVNKIARKYGEMSLW